MNEIVDEILLIGDKFMPNFNLRQPKFTYKACEAFTKHSEMIKTFKETGNLNHICKNKLDKASFAQDVADANRKDLA